MNERRMILEMFHVEHFSIKLINSDKNVPRGTLSLLSCSTWNISDPWFSNLFHVEHSESMSFVPRGTFKRRI